MLQPKLLTRFARVTTCAREPSKTDLVKMRDHQAAAATPTHAVYTPESALKHPLQLLMQMCGDVWGARELSWRLLRRDINAQYRQSLFGYAWAFLPPVVTALALTFASNSKFINVSATDLPYPAFVIFNMSLWQTFVEALNGPSSAVAVAKPMLTRINFPREAIIMAKVGEVGFNFAIKVVLILGAFLWFRVSVGWATPFAFVPVLGLILMGTAIGLFLAPFGGLYQDVSRALTVASGLWFFLTPIVYPLPAAGFARVLVKVNPVTTFVIAAREMATGKWLSAPDDFLIVGLLTLIGLLAAWLFFRLAMPFVIERLSS